MLLLHILSSHALENPTPMPQKAEPAPGHTVEIARAEAIVGTLGVAKAIMPIDHARAAHAFQLLTVSSYSVHWISMYLYT